MGWEYFFSQVAKMFLEFWFDGVNLMGLFGSITITPSFQTLYSSFIVVQCELKLLDFRNLVIGEIVLMQYTSLGVYKK